jgi:hypothetical protein
MFIMYCTPETMQRSDCSHDVSTRSARPRPTPELLVRAKTILLIVQAFLDATFRGWAKSAAKSVDEARAMLGLDEESNDLWHPSDKHPLLHSLRLLEIPLRVRRFEYRCFVWRPKPKL